MPPLCVGERDQHHDAARLRRIVVRDRGLETLAYRCRLSELTTQPAEQAHRCLVGHGRKLSGHRGRRVTRP